jgi:hypothetical protein
MSNGALKRNSNVRRASSSDILSILAKMYPEELLLLDPTSHAVPQKVLCCQTCTSADPQNRPLYLPGVASTIAVEEHFSSEEHKNSVHALKIRSAPPLEARPCPKGEFQRQFPKGVIAFLVFISGAYLLWGGNKVRASAPICSHTELLNLSVRARDAFPSIDNKLIHWQSKVDETDTLAEELSRCSTVLRPPHPLRTAADLTKYLRHGDEHSSATLIYLVRESEWTDGLEVYFKDLIENPQSELRPRDVQRFSVVLVTPRSREELLSSWPHRCVHIFRSIA